MTSLSRLLFAFLSIEAGDFEGAIRHCDEARRVYDERADIMLNCGERTARGRAYAGIGEFAHAKRCFTEVTGRIEVEGILSDSYFVPVLHLGLAECRLAQGDLFPARQHALRLCTVAQRPPENTYLAHGHRLLAEIAMVKDAVEEADEEIAQALDIVTADEVPLAAWRSHAAAATLCDRQGRSSKANTHRSRAADLIDAIAASLEPADPLRRSLCGRYAWRTADSPAEV